MAENIKQEKLLREKHFGVFEGQTSYEWILPPQNGESEETLQNRGKGVFSIRFERSSPNGPSCNIGTKCFDCYSWRVHWPTIFFLICCNELYITQGLS